MWLKNKFLYSYNCFKVLKFLRCLQDRLAYEVPKPKEKQTKHKKTDFSESSKKVALCRTPRSRTHTQEEILQKKPARNHQVSIRKESTHPKTCPSWGKKQQPALQVLRFISLRIVRMQNQASTFKNKKVHSKTEENYFTQRSTQHFSTARKAVRKRGFLQEGRFQRVTQNRADNIQQERCDKE